MNGENKRYSYWIPIIIVIILISLIVVYIQGKNLLNSYTGDGISDVEISDADIQIPLVNYNNDKYNYCIGIPSDWTKITKSGFDTFIHSPTETMVQVQVYDYTPKVINTTEETIISSLASDCELYKFSWLDATSYTVMYNKKTNKGAVFTNIEVVQFDRNNIIKVLYTYDNNYIEDMSDVITAIIDSFNWTKQNPFPTGTKIVYSDFGNFEFVFPSDWQTVVRENTFYSQNQSGSSMSITVNKSNYTYTDITQFDYIGYASQSRSNFALQEFTCDNNIVYAKSTYVTNNTQMSLIQYMMATGEYEYTVTFESPTSQAEANIELYSNLIDCFRIF